MKLLFAVKSLSTLGGGAERVFAAVVNGLHQRGHDLTLMRFEAADAPSFYPIGKAVRRLDIGGRAAGKLEQLRLLPRARRQIKRLSPDVVVAFMPSSYVPLAFALALSGVPVIASEHNVPERYRHLPMRWRSIIASSALVARYTAVSEQMRAAYPARIRNKMIVMPNPVTVPADLRANVEGKPGEGRIVSVGRLHKQKDQVTLIGAFAQLAAAFTGWSLRILGDGEERPALEQEVARLGLGGRVTLPGTVQDIGAEYGAAQLYVTPSRYESFGLATVEAIAHGLPAVGFADCPGTNEIIKTGVNGVLVEPGADRVDALANALRPLMAEPEARLSLASGAESLPSENQLPHVLDRWETFLRSIVQDRALER